MDNIENILKFRNKFNFKKNYIVEKKVITMGSSTFECFDYHFKLGGYDLTIIDTPGFCDTGKSINID